MINFYLARLLKRNRPGMVTSERFSEEDPVDVARTRSLELLYSGEGELEVSDSPKDFYRAYQEAQEILKDTGFRVSGE